MRCHLMFPQDLILRLHVARLVSFQSAVPCKDIQLLCCGGCDYRISYVHELYTVLACCLYMLPIFGLMGCSGVARTQSAGLHDLLT